MFDSLIVSLPIFIIFVFLFLSLYGVVKSADLFVDGAASLAVTLGVSTFVVGLTIIAIGTSAPELAVNSIAASKGQTQLSLGNIIGSNFANILLALGLAAIVKNIKVHYSVVWREFPFMLLSSFLILLFGLDYLFDNTSINVLTRVESIALLLFFIIFIVYTFVISKSKPGTDTENIKVLPKARSVLYTIGGLFGLFLFGDLLVSSAVRIAEVFDVSKNLVGLTIIAIGTSLPEIVTTVTAARKGHDDMLVGGIIGSNIFNALLILGVTGVIHHVVYTQSNIHDALTLLLVSLLLFLIMFVGKKHTLTRSHGMLFILIYTMYIITALIRG